MMNRYFYDFHVHSCLSPCGDHDMTPNNIAGMAAIKGLQIVALTDHNSTKNCRAFFSAAKKNGIIPIAGMEMTTAEDIHLVCLFPTLEKAEAFDVAYQKHRILYPNRPDIFGEQLILDENDNIIGEEKHLLLNASDLSVSDAVKMLKTYDAVVFPAHIDREENGMISSLGCIPKEPYFHIVEFRDKSVVESYVQQYGLSDKQILTDSDAHYLWDISEAENFLILEDEPYSSAFVRASLFRLLGGK